VKAALPIIALALLGCQSSSAVDPADRVSHADGIAPPDAFIAADDRAKARNFPAKGIPCVRPIRSSDGAEVASKPFRECYRLGPSKQMRGVWLHGMEESIFLPAGSAMPVFDDSTDTTKLIALEVDGTNELPAYDGGADAFAIVFTGRSPLYPGNYYGLFGNVVVPDRVISLRAIDRPRAGARIE
jgi:hypothetical protein